MSGSDKIELLHTRVQLLLIYVRGSAPMCNPLGVLRMKFLVCFARNQLLGGLNSLFLNFFGESVGFISDDLLL